MSLGSQLSLIDWSRLRRRRLLHTRRRLCCHHGCHSRWLYHAIEYRYIGAQVNKGSWNCRGRWWSRLPRRTVHWRCHESTRDPRAALVLPFEMSKQAWTVTKESTTNVTTDWPRSPLKRWHTVLSLSSLLTWHANYFHHTSNQISLFINQHK